MAKRRRYAVSQRRRIAADIAARQRHIEIIVADSCNACKVGKTKRAAFGETSKAAVAAISTAAAPRLEVNDARDRVRAKFNGNRALGHGDIADQTGRQYAEIDTAIPWHVERSPIKKHRRLPLFRTAHTRHGFTA